MLHECKVHLHERFLFLDAGVITFSPKLRVLRGRQTVFNTYEVLGTNMRYYINDVIDSSGLLLSQ